MGQRPPHVRPPAYLSKSPPVPVADPADKAPEPGRAAREGSDGPDPVRYGDWESKGIAIDF